MATQIGTSGSDELDGSIDPDLLDGEEGDDKLYGHGGDDTLYGDEGDDLLAGGEGDDLLDGGVGNDTLWGGSGADTIVFRDGYGDDVIMDFDPSTDLVSLSSSSMESWDDVSGGLGQDSDGTAVLTLHDGSTLRFEGLKPGQLSAANFVTEPAPVCLASGTRIRTPFGAKRVDDLRAGDLIDTLDHGPQRIWWVGRKEKRFGHVSHRHHPIRIPADAFAKGQPARDLQVSPQHRILLRDPSGQRRHGLFGKAKGFVGRAGITPVHSITSILYFQILLAKHGVIFAENLPVESFWPGPLALGTLSDRDRSLVEALVPGVLGDPVAAYGRMARPCLTLRALLRLLPCDVRVPDILDPCCPPSKEAAE